MSPNGCSVPDYLYSPIEYLAYCTEVKTLTVSEIINQFGLIPPNRNPDHSILIGTFKTSHSNTFESQQQQQQQQQQHQQQPHPQNKIKSPEKI